jgi:3-deoxy-D-manno-octulosonate 8-phosphate phosphatase (KDO 8-P phosphatase)
MIMTCTTDVSQVSADVLKRAAKIQLILMDVDGVLTDGTIHFAPGPDGCMAETKGFNSQDGLGFHFCNGVGIKTGVISGRDSMAVVERARMLKMTYVYQGLLAKEETYDSILADAKLSSDQVAFIGDDFTDAPLMQRSGLGVAVANARPEVKAVAHMVTEARGGDGAVREVIEVILKSQNLWHSVLEKYRLI